MESQYQHQLAQGFHFAPFRVLASFPDSPAVWPKPNLWLLDHTGELFSFPLKPLMKWSRYIFQTVFSLDKSTEQSCFLILIASRIHTWEHSRTTTHFYCKSLSARAAGGEEPCWKTATVVVGGGDTINYSCSPAVLCQSFEFVCWHTSILWIASENSYKCFLLFIS